MDKLEPCPFCMMPLSVGGAINPLARCETPDCWLSGRRISFAADDPKEVASWNRRPTDPRYGEAHSGLDDKQRHNAELSAILDAVLADALDGGMGITRIAPEEFRAPPPLCQRTLEAREIAERVVRDVEWQCDNHLPAKGETGEACYQRRMIDEITAAILALGKDDR